MKDSVKSAAYGILKNLTKDEVVELIEVLEYHNSNDQESQRADSLLNGRVKVKSAEEWRIEYKTAGSTNIYMQGGQSVCPCCKR